MTAAWRLRPKVFAAAAANLACFGAQESILTVEYIPAVGPFEPEARRSAPVARFVRSRR